MKTWGKKSTSLAACISQKDETQSASRLKKSRGCTKRRHSLSGACLDAGLPRRQSCDSGRVQLMVGERFCWSCFGCSCCVRTTLGSPAKAKPSPLPQPSKDAQTHLISSQVTIPGLAGAGVNSKAADAVQASGLCKCWSSAC